MKHAIATAAFCLSMIALTAPAGAQMGSGGQVQSSGAQSLGDHMGQNNMSQDEFNKLSEYVDQAKRLTKDDKAKGKTEADLKKEDVAAASELVKTLKVSCEVADAELVAQGKDGTKGYELACGNGMGYFLASGPSQAPYGVSCLTAQAKHDLDAAKHRTDDAECRLPANADLKAGVGRALASAGKTCAVQKISWMGRSDTTGAEYNEAACTGGEGYVLVSAEPGSTAVLHAMSCEDAASQGIGCKLTKVAGGNVATLTLQTFKDALAQHNVACDAGAERVIGQENVKKRYVVEFKCSGQPKGLVAFIPLAGNTAPFETTDCATAAQRGLACKLNTAE